MRSRSVLLVLMAACGGADRPYALPVDSPALPFSPPPAEELVGDGDWSGDAGVAEETGDPDPDTRPFVMVVVRSRAAFQSCYVRALERAPALRGRVELELTIGANGVPTSAIARGIPGVADCVARVARGLAFPKRRGGQPITVSYPFVFAPR